MNLPNTFSYWRPLNIYIIYRYQALFSTVLTQLIYLVIFPQQFQISLTASKLWFVKYYTKSCHKFPKILISYYLEGLLLLLEEYYLDEKHLEIY